MAEREFNTLIRRRDGNGNPEIHYPITQAANVRGLSEMLEVMKVDTNGLDGFDFDNLAGKPGKSLLTEIREDGAVWETIQDRATGLAMVRRITAVPEEEETSEEDESGWSTAVIERYEFFGDDGETVERTVTVTTLTDGDGNIREEVSA